MFITVRLAAEPDIEQLVELHRLVHERHLAEAPGYFKPFDPLAAAELFRQRLRQPETRVWVASIGDVVAGYAVAIVRERPENAVCIAQRFLEIEELSVAPAQRRQGVARALAQDALAEAHAAGLDDVQLTCWSFNAAAQATFQTLGFGPQITRFSRHVESSQP